MRRMAPWLKFVLPLLMAGLCSAVGASTLLAYYEQALQRDPDFASARALYQSDIRSRDLARSAFLPSINLSASSDRTQYQRRDLNASTVTSSGFDPSSVAVRLTQPLFNKDRSAFRRENELKADRAELVLAQARLDLGLRVVRAYFNYLLTLDQLALARAQADALQAQVTQLEHLLQSRTTTQTEVADARARRELAVVQIRAAQSALEVRKLDFIKLTGELPSSATVPLGRSPRLLAPEPADVHAWTKAAMESSFKVLAQRATVQLADVAVDRAKAGFYPQVSLVASRQRAHNSNYFTSMEQTDALSLQLNMNLFDGFNTRTVVEQSVAQAQKARFDLESAQHDSANAAGQAYWEVVNGIEQIRAMELAVAASELALTGTRMGIKANVKTYADELNAVQQLFTTRRDLQKERYSYLINHALLQSAVGSTDDAPVQVLAALLAP